MHVVIKGTNTIEEYKRVKAMMETMAEEMSAAHQKACGNWEHGDISKVWYDQEGKLSIEYQDGECWHYNEKGEWW